MATLFRRKSYALYTLGSFLAWALVLGVCELNLSHSRMQTVWAVFGGWCICFTSTFIARYIYEPPKKWTKK
jgi:hypothetical protein